MTQRIGKKKKKRKRKSDKLILTLKQIIPTNSLQTAFKSPHGHPMLINIQKFFLLKKYPQIHRRYEINPQNNISPNIYD